MKYLTLFLFTLLGAACCWFADFEVHHSWTGGEIDPHSWNLIGTVLLGGGPALFTLCVLQELRAQHIALKAAQQVGRRF